jgi:DNA modification methylase
MTDRVSVYWGDSRVVLADLPDSSVDAVVSDPPYALVSIVRRFGGENAAPAAGDVYRRASAGFMGKTWDTGETAFDPAFWVEVLRVAKPGAHMILSAGTRSYHRLACAVEDAGWEIRDMLAWLYGSGFPKSHDMAKAIDRERGLCGLTAANGAPVRRIKPGADQEKDGSWEKLDDRLYQPGSYMPASAEAEEWLGWGTALKPALEPLLLARKPVVGTVAGNLQANGTGALNIDACRIAAAIDDVRAGGFGAGKRPWEKGAVGSNTISVTGDLGRWPANVLHDGSDEVAACFPPSDEGSAARFFYSAKADTDDRLGSEHPTVKPVDLMAWMVRLITPGGGLVLDPFAGSGATGMACLREGFRAILIERERAYVDDINRRIAHVSGEDAPLFAGLGDD